MAGQAVKLKWNVGTIQDGNETAIVYEVNSPLGERLFAYKSMVGGVAKWVYISKAAIIQAIEAKRAFISRRLDFSRFFDVASIPESLSTGGYLTVSNEPSAGVARTQSVTTTYFSILGDGVEAPDLNANGIADGLEPETMQDGSDPTPPATALGFFESTFNTVKDFVTKNPVIVAVVVGFLFFTKPGKKFKKSVLKTVGLGGK